MAPRSAPVPSETERHIAEVTERGYTVIEAVLDRDEVEAFLDDTRRLHRELPTVVANKATRRSKSRIMIGSGSTIC